MAECLQVSPNKLVFAVQLNQQAMTKISLQNPTVERIAWKVKTTAPAQYSVKPAAGILQPGGTTEVVVTRAAAKKLPLPGENCHDKFRVEAIALPDGVDVVSTELFQAHKQSVAGTNIKILLIPSHNASPLGSQLAAAPSPTLPKALPAADPARSPLGAPPAAAAPQAKSQPTAAPTSTEVAAASAAAGLGGRATKPTAKKSKAGAEASANGAAGGTAVMPGGPGQPGFNGGVFVGRKVVKKFHGKYFQGQLTEYDPKEEWFRIVYEDGDEEDVGWDELQRILQPQKNSKGSGVGAVAIKATEPRTTQKAEAVDKAETGAVDRAPAAAGKKRVGQFPKISTKDRCGECKHCLNPSWHKPCLLARQRLEEGDHQQTHPSAITKPGSSEQTLAPAPGVNTAATATAASRKAAAVAAHQPNLATPAAGDVVQQEASETVDKGCVNRMLQRDNKGRRMSGLLAVVQEAEPPPQPASKQSQRAQQAQRQHGRGRADSDDEDWEPNEEQLAAAAVEGQESARFMAALAELAAEGAAQAQQREEGRPGVEAGAGHTPAQLARVKQEPRRAGSQPQPQQAQAGSEPEVIDLLDDSDDDTPLVHRPAARARGGAAAAVACESEIDDELPLVRRSAAQAKVLASGDGPDNGGMPLGPLSAAQRNRAATAAGGGSGGGVILTCSKKGSLAKRARLSGAGAAATTSQATTVTADREGSRAGEAAASKQLRGAAATAGPRTKASVRGQQPKLELNVQDSEGQYLLTVRVRPHTRVGRIMGAVLEQVGKQQSAELGQGSGRGESLVYTAGGMKLQEGQSVKELGLCSGGVIRVSAA